MGGTTLAYFLKMQTHLRSDAREIDFPHCFTPSRAVGVDAPPCLHRTERRFKSTQRITSSCCRSKSLDGNCPCSRFFDEVSFTSNDQLSAEL